MIATYHDVTFSQPSKPAGFMRIDSFTLLAFHRKPNAWRRFWYWALLGWRFEPSSTGRGDPNA